MKLFTTLPYKLVTMDGTLDPGQPQMAFIVKACFTLRNEQAAIPADKQADPSGDQPFMDEIGRSLRYPNDLVLFKPFGEVTLTADCHVPEGSHATETLAGLRIGLIAKTLRVVGDRVWVRDARGDLMIQGPQPFRSMPLRWERAFGGLSSAENPMGRGVDAWPAQGGGKHRFLANIERPGHPVVNADQRPHPAGFAPIAPHWQPRRGRQGTRDQHWATFVAPLPPADFDLRTAQAAPEDQWLEGYWRGDEPIELTNMHPTLPRLTTALPGLRLRLFAEIAPVDPGDTHFVEVPLDLDTVHIDVTAETMTLVWRRFFRPRAHGAPELLACYLAQERLSEEPAPLAAHHEAYRALRGPTPASKQAQALRDEQAALAEARKTLVDAKVDPGFLARFDAAPTSQDKSALMIDLLKSRTAELESMTAALVRP